MPDSFWRSLETLVHHAPGLVLAWIGIVGGCIGSFLNVVVYRLPEGMSLLYPGSHCPVCQHPIRWYDNLPVIGWLRLRGRCRDCQAAISVRYPLVEAIVAAMFVTQWLVDIGWNPPLDAGFRDALTSYAAHVILLSVCLATTLIDWDERPIPWSLLIWPAMIPLGGVVIGASVSTGGARLGAGVVCLIATAILHRAGRLARATPGSATTMMIGRWSVWGAIVGLNLGLTPSALALGGATLAWYLARRLRPTTGHSLWTALVTVATWLAVL